MKYDPEKHHRRSIRLKGYNYSQPGAYFVTIVTQDRECLFGEVVDGEMQLHDAGHMVCEEWNALPNRFPNVDLDAFIVMPNHIHGIIIITDAEPGPVGAGLVGAGLVPAPNGETPNGATTRVAPTLGDIVGALKSVTTVRYIQGVKQSGWPLFRGRLWQRNYYEHIIRDEESLHRIVEYIVTNPARWETDRENPQAPHGICLTDEP
ncbi:MAG: transposase [candidate division KSB1 bacterium]|nr:transposase [candidate division KSB1 bacterium]